MRVSGDKIIGLELKDGKSRGGLYVPETAVDTSRTATKRMRVLKIGPGLFAVELGRAVSIQEQLGIELKEGDVCVTSRYTYEYVWKGQKVRLFQASDILFVEDAGDAEAHQAT